MLAVFTSPYDLLTGVLRPGHVPLVVVQPTAAGYITTRAAVKADQLDPFRANNSRTAMVRVRPAA
jgi:hypothetical protein